MSNSESISTAERAYEVYSGGIGSYALLAMLIAFFKIICFGTFYSICTLDVLLRSLVRSLCLLYGNCVEYKGMINISCHKMFQRCVNMLRKSIKQSKDKKSDSLRDSLR